MNKVFNNPLSDSDKARVLVTSLPKSGTNVLESTLAQFPGVKRCTKLGLNSRMRNHPMNWLALHCKETCLMGVVRPQTVKMAAVRFSLSRMRPGDYALGHIPYQSSIHTLLEEMHVRPIFVIRDPRDVLVSSIHHAVQRKDHFLHKTMVNLPSHKDQIKAMITGGVTLRGEKYYGIGEQLDLVIGWHLAPNVMTVKFEDIIGPRGQGNLEKQARVIVDIGRFIGKPISTCEAERIGCLMFGKGVTFRKGRIGSWHEYFDDELLELFSLYAGGKLELLGY